MSKVLFSPVKESDGEQKIRNKVLQLYEINIQKQTLIDKDDFVALKIHFGERNNTGHIKPQYLSELIKKLKKEGSKPFFTDTNTLYRGQRANSIDHLNQAYKHGFNPEKVGIPVIISDGLMSKNHSEISIQGRHFDKVNIASDILYSDVLIGFSHLTGHMQACLGSTIKNIGMGCASRSGKQKQHADFKPKVEQANCIACGQCVKWCPVDAIEIVGEKAKIDLETCYGCAECLATCKYEAISISWSGSSRVLQEKMVEYCLGAIKDKEEKSLFFNFLIHITKNCDCLGRAQSRIIDDIGILVSSDPVAVDQAAVDLLNEHTETDFLKETWSESSLDYRHQLKYAEDVGLGSRNYDLKQL